MNHISIASFRNQSVLAQLFKYETFLETLLSDRMFTRISWLLHEPLKITPWTENYLSCLLTYMLDSNISST